MLRQTRRKSPGKLAFIVIGWVAFTYAAYVVSTTTIVSDIWDPYSILGISATSDERAIKKHFRKLSLQFHPDKVKPSENTTKEDIDSHFVELTKAYKALTDAEIRQNYLEYGHPDGKQDFSIGIALPQSIVKGANSYYVLLGYIGLLGAILPWIVGTWWYGSSKVTKDGVYNSTAGKFFRKAGEHATLMDVLEQVAAADEVAAVVHEDDQLNLDKLLAGAGLVTHSSVAVELVLAHLHRIDVMTSPKLEDELNRVVPLIVKLQHGYQKVNLSYNYLQPLENSIKLTQCLIQAVPLTKTYPLLQLPGVTPAIADKAYREHRVWRIQDLLAAADAERVLQGIEPSTQLAMKIARRIPIIEIKRVEFRVLGDQIITPGSLVQLQITACLKDYQATEKQDQQQPADLDADEDDVDVLLNRSPERDGPSEDTPLAHAPYFPAHHRPSWFVYIADLRQNRVIVHPQRITGIPHASIGQRKYRIQFQAPPSVGLFIFQMAVRSSCYLGVDWEQEVHLNVQDAKELITRKADDDISDPEEGEFLAILLDH